MVPFYDQMIQNAANRLFGSNQLRVDLPQHPQKIIQDFKKRAQYQTTKYQPNHFYAFKIKSLLTYLIPQYWIHFQRMTGMAPSRQAYDLYQIPLNSSSTVNYYAFRGDNHISAQRLFNCFLFGGNIKDSKFSALKNFISWANDFIKDHPVTELKKYHVIINPDEVRD